MASVREIAKNYTMENAQTLCKDTTYIPSEKLDWSPMDYGKSAVTILAECAKLNLIGAAVLRGEIPQETTKEMDFLALKSHVLDSAQEVCKAIDSLSDQDLEGTVQFPWGMVMPAAEAIFLPASHMSYHDGQINYIQLLLGDTKFHWAEE